MKKTSISCDFCNSDLTYSNGGYDHCLHLIDRRYGPSGSIIIDYYMLPLLDEDLYFCGFMCLEKWFENRSKEKSEEKSEEKNVTHILYFQRK